MTAALRALAQSKFLAELLRDVCRRVGAARLQDSGSQTSLDVSRLLVLSEDNEGAAAGLQQALAASQRQQSALQSELRAAQEAIQLMVPRIHELQQRNSRLYEALGRAHSSLEAAAAQVGSAAAAGGAKALGSPRNDAVSSAHLPAASLSQLAAGLQDAMADVRRTMAEEEEEEDDGVGEAELRGDGGLASPPLPGGASGGSSRRRDDAGVSPDQAFSPVSARRRSGTPSNACLSAAAAALVHAALQRAMGSAVSTPRGVTPRGGGCGTAAPAAALTPRSGTGKVAAGAAGTGAPVPPLPLAKALEGGVPPRSRPSPR
ncbi:hypothetical protein HXX76_016171 [Chlamydomonas incerta]|uniref:Uncharacterized protein n=1 Tax=Chlamydomonas incerta TaxID=51695 RepID=A0A835S7N4_CHLIN|nr:hypothetical protein HXX76_016171 [Chlamydomonas incerta]|eukprot:KAG2422257.1 hypothetical protein HXX76_016171 [Chlamydomonas incerta]